MSNYYNIMAVKKRQPLLLDLFPNAAVAYSLRKLRTAYLGSAIRVRRSSDNTEQDSFDSTSLLSFVGVNNGLQTTFYDQSSTFNATQATAGNQPILVSSGSLITSGGLQAIQGGSTLGVRTTTLTLNTAPILWFFLVVDVGNTSTLQVLFETSSNFNNFNGALVCFIQSGNLILAQRRTITSTYSQKSYPLSTGIQIISGFFEPLQTTANASKIYSNGVEINGTVVIENNTLVLSNQILSLFSRNGNSNGFLGKYQEAIFYLSNQSLNRNEIETNINSHYNIYP
jgi:hypothetical protein